MYTNQYQDLNLSGLGMGCCSCEQVCPQGIKISEMMADFAEKLK